MASDGMNLNALEYMMCMDQLAKEVPDHMGFVVRWQQALWVKWIIGKVGGDPKKGLPAYRASMKKVIESDLNKLFAPVSESDKISDMNSDGNATVTTRNGAKFWIKYDRHISSFNHMLSVQAEARIGDRRGRVRNTGDWNTEEKYKGLTLSKKYFIAKSMLKSLIVGAQQHIGRTKSAWCKAGDYFASKCKGAVTSMYPDWIGVHKMWASSYSVSEDLLNVQTMTGHVMAGSNVPWAKDPDKMIEAGLKVRRMDIERGYAAKRLVAILKEHSAKAAA